ncbi:MAG: signal peptidase I [Elusimicrobia bacterium]|nr:signal peptidase I [Elusimicrobiota bacterium]
MTTTTPLRFAVIAALSIGAALMLRRLAVERIYVASVSMEPTMPLNSRWWVDKISPRLRRLHRQDIVIFPSPLDPSKELLKRVIAISGDTIEIRNKVVYLNGDKQRETYLQYKRSGEILMGDNLGPLTVPQHHVFVMGDNRDESGDSRDWKNVMTGQPIYFIPLSSVKGRVLNPPSATLGVVP